MITTKSCQFAIRALIYLALNSDGKPIQISRLHKDLNVGAAYLTKILQPLTQHEILVSYKGTNGGVQLNRPADKISLYEIVHIIDGDALFDECALGIPTCSIETPCAFHFKWADIRDEIKFAFHDTTIADLAASGGQV
ncbi:Rrf2 family transcriptional regulator [bacterium]|nr:MAG: Rrf2 family transcriptional regulator [bacterium]